MKAQLQKWMWASSIKPTISVQVLALTELGEYKLVQLEEMANGSHAFVESSADLPIAIPIICWTPLIGPGDLMAEITRRSTFGLALER